MHQKPPELKSKRPKPRQEKRKRRQELQEQQDPQRLIPEPDPLPWKPEG
jgi:hypothetical protein